MQNNKGRQIIFWGDSNTFGYDPADMIEMRYPADVRWTDVLQKNAGEKWRIVPQGLNGRRLPADPENTPVLGRLLRTREEEGILAVMLGTNDVLQGSDPDASEAIRRMERLLAYVSGKCPKDHFLVIAPVYSGREDSGDDYFRAVYRESVRMNREFKKLAERSGVLFADVGTWGIDTAFDQIHFSAKGSLKFADEMGRFLDGLAAS